ncbi:MAG: EamA family transporter, partial [Pseudomonadales bacterium]|nr:EamA family transporter [Pseudomonadales bacterium]
SVLLMLGGAVTSFPLLCFAAAVTRLSLTVMGMFQYLAPSLSLMIALLVYGEPFRLAQALTFGCIWIALVLFTIESVHFHRKLRRQLAA